MEILNQLNSNKLNSNKLSKTNSIKNNNDVPKEGIIKGEVVDIKGLAVKILTSNGQYISGKMQEADILNMGEEKLFEVINENGQVKMKTLSLSSQENKLLQIKKALSELGIVNSETDEAIAKELMNNELPVNEKMLKDLGRLLKLFNASNKPSESIKQPNNFSENNQILNKQSENQSTSILQKNNVDKGIFILKNEIPVNLKNANIVTDFANKNVNIQNDLSNIAEDINNIKDNEFKETLQNIIMYGDEEGITTKNVFSKTNITNLQSILKNILNHPNNTNQHTAEHKILNLLNNKTNELTNKNFTTEDLLKLSKNDLSTLLKEVNKKDLVKVIKENVKEVDFSLKLNSGTLEEVEDFFEETTTKFEKLLKQLQSKEEDGQKQLFEKLSNVKDKMDFSNHIKNNVFLQLPLNINEHKTNGELTIFKDKRKKGCKDVSSALISLDTRSLGIFETFIQKQNNNLNLQFRLESKEIENIVKQHLNTLKSTLNLLRYNIDNISFKTNEQSFSILNSEDDLKDLQLNLNNTNTIFDAKA